MRKGSPPSYHLVAGKDLAPARRQEAVGFLETLHQFIGANRKRIRLTKEARVQAKEENRLQEIADRGKQKPPVTIRCSRVYRPKKNVQQEEGKTK